MRYDELIFLFLFDLVRDLLQRLCGNGQGTRQGARGGHGARQGARGGHGARQGARGGHGARQ